MSRKSGVCIIRFHSFKFSSDVLLLPGTTGTIFARDAGKDGQYQVRGEIILKFCTKSFFICFPFEAKFVPEICFCSGRCDGVQAEWRYVGSTGRFTTSLKPQMQSDISLLEKKNNDIFLKCNLIFHESNCLKRKTGVLADWGVGKCGSFEVFDLVFSI